MATVATGQVPPAGFTPTRTTTSIAATVRRVFPSTASRLACQKGLPTNDAQLSRLHGLHPSFVLAAFSVKISALCRRRCALKHRHSSRLVLHCLLYTSDAAD